MDLHLSPLRACGLLLCLALLVGGVSAASTDVRVVKLAADGKTVIAERTVDYRWLEANLPVRGDGSTHYYHQGPTFDDADLWDPTESKNVEDKDMGAVKGTALRDLCGLAGGMQSGDTLVVRASDGFSKRFSYGSVYSPSARQGQMVLTWYKAGEGYVPSYSTGMRTVFFADTSTNPWGRHVFGNADMKATMPSSEWHYFNGVYPTTTGLSVQSVSELRILSTQSAVPTTTTATTAATTAAKTTVATTKTATPPATTGATAAPTTAQGATTVPTASAAPDRVGGSHRDGGSFVDRDGHDGAGRRREPGRGHRDDRARGDGLGAADPDDGGDGDPAPGRKRDQRHPVPDRVAGPRGDRIRPDVRLRDLDRAGLRDRPGGDGDGHAHPDTDGHGERDRVPRGDGRGDAGRHVPARARSRPPHPTTTAGRPDPLALVHALVPGPRERERPGRQRVPRRPGGGRLADVPARLALGVSQGGRAPD